jgi:hypothetical protein
MKKILVLAAIVISIGLSSPAFAADNSAQTITYEVQSINEIAVSGNPGALVVNTAVAGSQPTAATDATTTYSITTNSSFKKITGMLSAAMPANTALRLTLTAPTGASSAGQVTLTASAQDLVTGISTLAEGGLGISYEFSATLSAGIISSAQRTVTLTVVDGAV